MSKTKKTRNRDRQARTVATVPVNFTASAQSGGTLTLAAAEGEGALPRISGTLYTGDVMQLDGWNDPVVVDLAGLQFARQVMPIRLNHSADSRVGHTTRVWMENGRVLFEGVASSTTDEARAVVADAKNGFPWQASMGARSIRREYVEPGDTVTVNGREMRGPLLVSRETLVREATICDLGADAETETRISARAAAGGLRMNFSQWLKAMGLDEGTLSAAAVAKLRAQYEAEQSADDEEKPAETPETKTETPAPAQSQAPAFDLAAHRAVMAAEETRCAELRRVAGSGHPDLLAQAITAGWDGARLRDAVELADLRAARPTGLNVPNLNLGATGGAKSSDVLEAAALVSSGMREDRVLSAYSAPVMEAAQKFRGIGLKELMAAAMRMEGRSLDRFDTDSIQAAFTTMAVPGILGNVLRKSLQDAFEAVDPVSTRVFGQGDVSDFKTHTRYQMGWNGELAVVGDDGQLKDVLSANEASYTQTIDTRGALVSLSRQTVINDDLGAFTRLARDMGDVAAKSREKLAFWKYLDGKNNASLFHANNSNYDGSGNALGIAGLNTILPLYAAVPDVGGKGFAMRTPKILLVPNALWATAQGLWADPVIIGTPASNKLVTNGNPYKGMFDYETSIWLSAGGHANVSSTAWAVLATPGNSGVVEIGYLRGNRNPTVRSATPAAGTLALVWEIFWDIGFAFGDKRMGYFTVGA